MECCYSITKNNEILPFATVWMDLDGIMLGEISQSEKDKYYMWDLKNNINKQNRNTVIGAEHRLMVARGQERWRDSVKRVKGLRSTDW